MPANKKQIYAGIKHQSIYIYKWNILQSGPKVIEVDPLSYITKKLPHLFLLCSVLLLFIYIISFLLCYITV